MAAAISAIRKSTAGGSTVNDSKHDLLAKLPDAELREMDINLGMLLTG
jgi:hypothetical protein